MSSRQPPGVGGAGGITTVENNINNELSHIPPSIMHQLKQDAGFGAKDLPSLTLADKVGFRCFVRLLLSVGKILIILRLLCSNGS